MALVSVKLEGGEKLKKGLLKSPEILKLQAQIFLVRLMAEYKRAIVRNPWRVGGSGGGSPVSSRTTLSGGRGFKTGGTLRGSHRTRFREMSADIGPDPHGPASKYAVFVHEGTSKMESRPWLSFAVKDRESEAQKLMRGFLDIVMKKITT